ncbi:MAG: ATP-binding protein [Opitutales bacterium]
MQTLPHLRALGLAILGLVGHLVCAQKPYQPLPADSFREPWRWRDVEFLEGEAVTSMAESPDGSIWFGAEGALIHYDGLNFERIDLSTVTDVPTPGQIEVLEVRALTVTAGGLPLFLLKSSLVVLENGRVRKISDDIGFVNNYSKFVQDRAGRIYLLTRDRLLHVSEDLSAVTPIYRVRGRERLYACFDSQDRVWVLMLSANSEFKFFSEPVESALAGEARRREFPGLPFELGISIANLHVDSKDRIYYSDASRRNGIYVFNTESHTWTRPELPEHSLSHYYVSEMIDGSMCFLGAGEILRLSESGASYYSSSVIGLPVMPLQLLETRNRRVWVLSYLNKVRVLDLSDTFETYSGLHFLFESNQGKRWFVDAHQSIVVNDPLQDSWIQYDKHDGIVESIVGGFESEDGAVWILGVKEGVAAVSALADGSSNAWLTTKFPELGPSTSRHAWAELDDGSIIIGTDSVDQWSEFDGGFVRLRLDEALGIHQVDRIIEEYFPINSRHLAQTSDGLLWSAHNGLRSVNLDSKEVARDVAIPMRRGDRLLVGETGDLWLGIGGFGVWRKTDDRWIRYSTKDGLSSNFVSGLAILDGGKVVAASENGYSRFDGYSWTRHALPSSLSILRRRGALMRGAGDTLWMNLTSSEFRARGLARSGHHTRFCTVLYRFDKNAPETFLEEYQASVSHKGNTLIRWGGYDMWNYTPSSALKYSWKLNDGSWSPFSEEKTRSFVDLPYGSHRLAVRARDGDHNVDLSPAVAYFVVEKPFWLRSWVLLICFTVFAVSIYQLLYTLRSRRLRLEQERTQALDRQRHLEEIDALKTGYVNNISHELNTPLTSLMIPLDSIVKKESDPDKRRRLSLVLRNAERIKKLVSQLVLFRDAEKKELTFDGAREDISKVIRDRIEGVRPFADDRGVKIVESGPSSYVAEFCPDIVERVADNLLSNAVKYTGKNGLIRIEWTVSKDDALGDVLNLLVEDNGPGIPEEHLPYVFERFYRIPGKSMVDGSGIGLNLTQELVNLCGGRIRVVSPIYDSARQPGTRFEVSIPLRDRSDR